MNNNQSNEKRISEREELAKLIYSDTKEQLNNSAKNYNPSSKNDLYGHSNNSELQKLKDENIKLKQTIERLAVSTQNSNEDVNEITLNAGGHQAHFKVGEPITSEDLVVIQILSNYLHSQISSNSEQTNEELNFSSTTPLDQNILSDIDQYSEATQENLSKLVSLCEKNRKADEQIALLFQDSK